MSSAGLDLLQKTLHSFQRRKDCDPRDKPVVTPLLGALRGRYETPIGLDRQFGDRLLHQATQTHPAGSKALSTTKNAPFSMSDRMLLGILSTPYP